MAIFHVSPTREQQPRQTARECRGSPLQIANRMAVEGDIEGLRALLDAGMNPNGDETSKSPAFVAFAWKRVDCLPLLLEYGLDSNLADGLGRTLAMSACEAQRPDMLQLLIDRQCDLAPRARGFDGATALMFSTSDKTGECMRMLLKAGAPIDARDSNGNTAAAHACIADNPTALALLREAGANLLIANLANETLAIHASARSRVSTIGIVLSAGVDPDAIDSRGHSALAHACWHGNHVAARALLAKGCNPSPQNREGSTPAMLACANDHDSCLAVLIEFGCDLDIRDENGLRAEEIAAREGDTRCLQRIRSAIQRLAIASACGPTNAASSALRI